MAHHFTISVSRTVPVPPAVAFAHWTSPATRVRWEAGPDTGMVYDTFDSREGGTEIVRITQDGRDLGRLVQTILLFDPPKSVVMSVRAQFGPRPVMVSLITVGFEPVEDGTIITGTSQIAQLIGQGGEAQQQGGWEMLFDRFTADLAAHGPPVHPSNTP